LCTPWLQMREALAGQPRWGLPLLGGKKWTEAP
jgi:hypothetical protein